MQNTDNLRTLTGPKRWNPLKAKPAPNVQDKTPVPDNLKLLRKKPRRQKKKKFANLPPKYQGFKYTTPASNNPNTQELLVPPTPPGPGNTQGPTSVNEPNDPTRPIDTTQIGVSGPSTPTWLINTPDQMRPINKTNTKGHQNPNWSINTLGKGHGSGSLNQTRHMNEVDQTDESSGPANPGDQTGTSEQYNPNWSTNPVAQMTGTNKPSGPVNASPQASTSQPNKLTDPNNIPGQSSGPNWSINSQGFLGSGMNPSRPTAPLGQAVKTQKNKPVPNKGGPRFQPPQKEQQTVNVVTNVTMPTIPVIGERTSGDPQQMKDKANWMKSIRNIEEMAQHKNQINTQLPQDLCNKNVTPTQGLLPTPVMETQATKSVTPANNISINLNKEVFKQTMRRPRMPQLLGIPKSFIIQALQDNYNEQSKITTSYEVPAWQSQGHIATNTPTFAPTQGQPQAMANDYVMQSEARTDIQQPYSPSDVYDESSFGEDHDGYESSELGQSAQKRLSAFQRLGPLSQPKKPKLTINLMFNKEQAVREVVDATEEDSEKYTPVHLRADVMASTDETVVKFLAFWPWKKRVPLRKSVTSRSSKSVMLMEQEQMEEIYDKDNVFMQVTVRGYPKYWDKEHILDSLLDVVKGKSFIPCFTEFTEEECKFLVLRSRPALVMFHKCGFVVRKDDIELTIVISHTDLSLKLIDFIPRLVLRKRLMLRYDGERKLDLKKFTLKEDISHFIYYPLNRLTNQVELIQLQSTIAWEYLTDLDLSYNRLTSVSGFDLPSTCPRLKCLNLSHNYIEKVTELLKCRGMALQAIWLEGNPLCHDYIDSRHYIKVIKMMFNSVMEIDGVPITLKGDLPPIKRNYCRVDAVGFVEKFLEVYFPLLDSTPDDRPYIQNLYAENATMTITCRNKMRHGPVYRSFRSLFLRSRELEAGETDCVETSSSIGKVINRWPEFEHDPLTFTVDVMHYDDFSAILRVGGIVKLKAESLAVEEHMLAFTRTFVLRSNDGVNYKIQNELVYWDHPTEETAVTAFKVTTVKPKQMSYKLDSAPSEDLKDKLLALFMNTTMLKRKSSERCLELKNWNFKEALEHFIKLLKLDSLESLTKDEVCI